MYRVTIYNDGEGTIIHEVSTNPAEPHLYSCTLTEGESGSIDSLEFTILPNNPGYEILNSRTTTITVLNTKTEEEEFKGRVLTITPQMEESGFIYKKVVCESRLGYLYDSIQPYTEKATYVLEDFFKLLLENHNSQVEDYKKIYPGTISVTASASTGNVTKELNYESTWEALNSKLLDTEGGEISLYDGDDGLMYLDYVDELGEQKTETIEFAKNMKAVTREIDPSEIITRLIPLGAKVEDESGNTTDERLTIASVNDDCIYLDNEDLKATYGIVEGIAEWSDVTEADNLLTKAKASLKSQSAIDSVSISALDLSLVGIEEEAIRRYNYYKIINNSIGLNAYFRVIKRTVDICDPSNITFELGSKGHTISDAVNNSSSSSETSSLSEEISDLSDDITDKSVIVVTGTNDADLTITSEEATAIEITVYSQNEAIPIFIGTFPIYSDTDGEIVATTYVGNNQHNQFVGQLQRGDNILTFTDNFSISESEQKTFRVTLYTQWYETDKRIMDAKIDNLITFAEGGEWSSTLNIDGSVPEGTILKNGIVSEIFLQGGAAADLWDGQIDVSDIYEGISYGNNYMPDTLDYIETLVDASTIDTSDTNIKETISNTLSYGNNYTVNTSSYFDYAYIERGGKGLWIEYIEDTWSDVSSMTWGEMGDDTSETDE